MAEIGCASHEHEVVLSGEAVFHGGGPGGKMADALFKAGDVVQMKSDQIDMVVQSAEQDSDGSWEYFCTWREKGVRKTDTFPEVVLRAKPARALGAVKISRS